MKIARFLLVMILALVVGAPQMVAAEEEGEPTLYSRIGGYDVIAGIVDDFLPRIGGDPHLGRLISLSRSTKGRNRQLIVDLICKESGGPCLYNGRTMEASHQGLGITDNDWLMMMGLFEKSLDKFDIKGDERKELIALVESLRKGIVEKED